MAKINILDKNTIDQIAAGEVVERPSSVVKELVENAMDSGASAITVEIHGGGIDLIRITDNGCGIEKSEIRKAFLRHATSKLNDISDLFTLSTLGFRGEALSSISAVSQVELITKTESDLTGIRYVIEGGEEKAFEEIGAPSGTTIVIRNLFFNTPARRKFLKSPRTEGSYVADLMEHLALDNPSVSFRFINNKDDRFHTSGNGDLKELVYRIYGRDVSMAIIPIKCEAEGIKMEGYLGEPSINRSNRNFEIFFINGRYIKDKVISKAIEEGYKQYLMQHKFPFCILHFEMDKDLVDVNVHPSKMEVKFQNQHTLFEFIRTHIEHTLRDNEMIPEALRSEEDDLKMAVTSSDNDSDIDVFDVSKNMTGSFHGRFEADGTQIGSTVFFNETEMPDEKIGVKEAKRQRAAEPFEKTRFEKENDKNKAVYAQNVATTPVRIKDDDDSPIWSTHKEDDENQIRHNEKLVSKILGDNSEKKTYESPIIKKNETTIVEQPRQMEMFEDKMLSVNNRDEYKIIGQVFGTYWIFEFKDKLYVLDQHAAHEKVNFERMMAHFKNKQVTSQMISPPIILTLSSSEMELYHQFNEYFENLGFQIDDFGGSEIALRAIPQDLYGCDNAKQMFEEILDELSQDSGHREPDVIYYKIASMACKASVKGNTRLSLEEVKALIDKLLTLENPYNCPHGRPTIISMSKYEIDKRFKRVVD